MLLMGKSTISMAIFHCYVSSPEGNMILPVVPHKAVAEVSKIGNL